MGFISSLIVLFTVLSFCIYVLTFRNFEWSTISIESITKSKFFSDHVILCLRLFMTFVVWFVLVFALLIDKVGLKLNIATREKKTKLIHICGFRRLEFFTWWSWLLEGVYFLLLSILSLDAYFNLGLLLIVGDRLHLVLIRSTWILFEISFAVSCLVSIVVSHILIPSNQKENVPVDMFFQPTALITHNANILFMSSELLLGSMKFSTWHVVFALLYALAYVLFSWYWYMRVGVFYYFFLDYASQHSHFWYLGLCAVFSSFFYFGYAISHILQQSSTLAFILVTGLLYFAIKLKP